MNKDEHLVKIVEHCNREIPTHKPKFAKMMMEAFLMGKEYGRQEREDELKESGRLITGNDSRPIPYRDPPPPPPVTELFQNLESVGQLTPLKGNGPTPKYGPPEPVDVEED